MGCGSGLARGARGKLDVVGSCFAIIVLNLVISTIGYFFVPAL